MSSSTPADFPCLRTSRYADQTCSTVIGCDFVSSCIIIPRSWRGCFVGQHLNNPAPSLRPVSRVSSLLWAGPTTCGLLSFAFSVSPRTFSMFCPLVARATPVSCPHRFSLVPYQCLNKVHAVSMPVTVGALSQVRLPLVPKDRTTPLVLITSYVFRHFFDRFTFVHLPYSYLIPFLRPFPLTFNTEPLQRSAP